MSGLWRFVIPVCLVFGGVLWVALQHSPSPTFNYHGTNTFWGPLLLRLVLGPGALVLLVGAGPLAVVRFLIDRRALSVESVGVCIAGLLACTFVLAHPLCDRLLPGPGVIKHVGVAVALTSMVFVVIAPGVVVRLGCALVVVIVTGALLLSFSMSAERDPLALQRTVMSGSVTATRFLLTAGHNPNEPPVLVNAVGAEMVKLLLAHGADPNAHAIRQGTDAPETPLSKACKQDDLAAITALLDAGANVDDELALKNAASWMNSAYVRLLLLRGADVRTPGILAVLVAAEPRDAALLQLEERVLATMLGPQHEKERELALGNAIWKNNIDAVTLLLPTVRDRCSEKSGKPLEIARRLSPSLVSQVLASCDAEKAATTATDE